MKKCLNKDIFRIITRIADKENTECYVIGGFVRDYILNRSSPDIDIVCIGSGIDLAKKVASEIGQGTKVKVFRNFGTARINYQGSEIEFVGARKESYFPDSRKPLVEKATLEDDFSRRDFTINTLAVSLNKTTLGNFIDPFNGLDDLNNRVITTPLEPGSTFSDDPLRMLRAIRFANQLNFRISEKTFEAIKEFGSRIKIVSRERIVDEINKILMSPVPSTGFYLLDESGLLELIIPELIKLKGVEVIEDKGHKDNFIHTLQVVDNISKKSDNLWLRWSGLLHDIAKPQTKNYSDKHGWTFHGHNEAGLKMIPDIFKRLKQPMNEKMRYVQKMVGLHMRPIVLAQEIVTDSAIRRLLFEAGNDTDDLMILCEADVTSKNRFKVSQYRKNFSLVRKKLQEIEEKDAIRNWQPPVSGNDIMKIFGLPPSKEVGILKNAVREAILDGEIKNNRKEALRYMKGIGKELGLKLSEG